MFISVLVSMQPLSALSHYQYTSSLLSTSPCTRLRLGYLPFSFGRHHTHPFTLNFFSTPSTINTRIFSNHSVMFYSPNNHSLFLPPHVTIYVSVSITVQLSLPFLPQQPFTSVQLQIPPFTCSTSNTSISLRFSFYPAFLNDQLLSQLPNQPSPSVSLPV